MYRNEILNAVELKLVEYLDGSTVNHICNDLLVVLNDYEVDRRCRDLVPFDTTNEELLKRYVACMLVDGKSQRTIKAYLQELQRFSNTIGKNFDQVTSYDIRTYLAINLGRGCSKSYVDTSRCYISAFYRWLYREEIIPKNPAESVSAIKQEQVIKTAFSDIEIDAMRNTPLSLRDRAIFEILISSGARVSELCNLDKSDVDLSNLSIRIRNGKGGKDRITFMSRVASHHLKLYLNSRADDSDALFLAHEEREVKFQQRIEAGGVRHILTTIGHKTKISKVHPHRFRRTFATTMYRKGMDISEIQKLLGHANVETTLRYISTETSDLEASYKKRI